MFFNKYRQNKRREINPDQKTFLVVGLGNPGGKFEKTRHNIGFDAVDSVAKKEGVKIVKSKFNSLLAQTFIGGNRVIFQKPQTFMNLSGKAVAEAAKFYKIPPENVVVLFDDVSLPPGKVRIRAKGSHGGHNGIRNIIDCLDTDEFLRIKIGVGERPNPNYDLADWVLSRFTAKEREEVEKVIAMCADIVTLLVKEQTQQAMSDYNGL